MCSVVFLFLSFLVLKTTATCFTDGITSLQQCSAKCGALNYRWDDLSECRCACTDNSFSCTGCADPKNAPCEFTTVYTKCDCTTAKRTKSCAVTTPAGVNGPVCACDPSARTIEDCVIRGCGSCQLDKVTDSDSCAAKCPVAGGVSSAVWSKTGSICSCACGSGTTAYACTCSNGPANTVTTTTGEIVCNNAVSNCVGAIAALKAEVPSATVTCNGNTIKVTLEDPNCKAGACPANIDVQALCGGTGTCAVTCSGGLSSSGSTCFPSSSSLELENGSVILMDALQVGHKVRVGPQRTQ